MKCPECNKFPRGMRKWKVCRGEVNLTHEKINAYRVSWGLEPLFTDVESIKPRESNKPVEVISHGYSVSPSDVDNLHYSTGSCKSCGKGKRQNTRKAKAPQFHKSINHDTEPPKILPGSALKKVLSRYGAKTNDNCGCTSYANKLDELGLEWCQNNTKEIVSELKSNSKKVSGFSKLLATIAPKIALEIILKSSLDLSVEIYQKELSVYSKNIVWAYGVTTVSERFDNYLPQTLKSLEQSGFDNPHLFIDGSKESELPKELLRYNLTCRNERIKTFANWILSLQELFLRNPRADRYAIFQDDLICSKNLKLYLDSCYYPKKGYWNLFAFQQNEKIQPKGHKIGWYPSNQRGLSALGIVLNRDRVQEILSSSHMINRPTQQGNWHKTVDIQIAKSLTPQGITEYVHGPNLINHIGIQSSMSNGKYKSVKTFQGENFDLKNIAGKGENLYDKT